MQPVLRPALLVLCATLPACPAAAQDPNAIVAARRAQMAAMGALGYHLESEAAGADEATYFRLTEEADAVAALLRAVPLLFPEGTAPADLPEGATQAAPAVWEDRAGFEAAAATALAAAEAAALAPDAAALAAAWGETAAACAACHEGYLAYDPFGG